MILWTDYNLIIKMGITEFVLEIRAVKSKTKGVFTGCTVAMAIFFTMRLNHIEASLPRKTPVICLESGLVTFHKAV